MHGTTTRPRKPRAARAWVLALALICAGCEETLCDAGCSEEESDCFDDPESYVTLTDCESMEEDAYEGCVEEVCEGVYLRCSDSCAESTDPSFETRAHGHAAK